MATLVLRAGKGSPLTNAEVDANFTNLNTEVAAAALTASWTGVTGKPATLAGYGITDAQPVDADLTAIAALAGTSGFLKKTAANTWALDTTAYITASASITGNAATATALQTARTINGVSFNGSANVTVTTAGTGIGVSGTAVSIAAAYSPNTATELAGSFDLNTLQTPGFYAQSTNADATSGLNYPNAQAGSIVVQNAAGVTQQYYTYNPTSPEFYFRAFYNTVWSPWRRALTDTNFNSYSPTLTGTGASGTWGIGITGNAATVTNGLVSTGSYADPAWLTSVNYSKLTGTVPTWNQSTTGSAATLTTGRTIALTGDVTYTSGSFNGSANVTGTATLAASGVTAGTYTKVTVDAKGRVTTGAALAAGDVPTLNQSTTGNAATATTLQTARTINGISFNGSANITVADSTKLPLAGGTLTGNLQVNGNLNVGLGGGDLIIRATVGNDLGDLVWADYAGTEKYRIWDGGTGLQYRKDNGAGYMLVHAGNYNSYSPTLTGTGASGSWGISVTGSSASTTGNAATATTLQTARTLTIGSTGKTFNGSANVAWSLAEIGALGASAKAADSELLDGYNSDRFLRTYADSSMEAGVHGGNLNGTNMQYLLAREQVQNLVAYVAPTSYETWNGSAWVSTTVPTAIFRNKPSNNFGGLTIANGVTKVRFTWLSFGYKFWSTLATAGSTNGNSFRARIYTSSDNVTWVERFVSGYVTDWPGYHVWPTYYGDAAFPHMRIELEFTYANANACTFGDIALWGAYGGYTPLFDWDFSRNITLGGDLQLLDKVLRFDQSGTRSWTARATGGNLDIASGDSAGLLRYNSNTILHAGNYNSYSPTLTGTGASGSWGISVTGNAANVTGTVAIANGGTGQTTRQNAMDALAGAVTSGQYLRGNGTDVVMSAIQAADVPTLNQSTTGNAGSVTNGVYTTGEQTITARKIFSTTNSAIASASGDLSTLEVRSTSTGAAFMAFHRPTFYAAYFGLDSDNVWKVGGWSMGANAYPILHSNNYNSYAPTLTGTGASGTWGISVSGNAASATRLINLRTINGVGFDGTANITVADSTKLALSGGTMTGAITTPNGAVGINIGDDVRFADRNVANTLYLEGQANNDRGYINFGSTAGTVLGAIAGGALTYNNNVVLHAGNYTSYSPSLTGSGASGSWGISVTGSAATLTTARTLWGQSFNGSANVTGALSSVTTLAMSGQLTNTVAVGTAPMVITSTTRVANLNVATAGTADTLTTARTINGVSFNGSANITVADSTKLPLAGGTLTGALTIQSAAPILNFFESDQTLPAGRRRFVQDGNTFSLRRNTAAGGDFSTEVYDLNVDASGNFTALGNVTAYSDERVKENWESLADDFVDRLAEIKSGTFDRTDIKKRQAGVSAQSMQKLLPEVVDYHEKEELLSVAYGNAALVSAVELAKDNLKLRARVERLEALVEKLIGD